MTGKIKKKMFIGAVVFCMVSFLYSLQIWAGSEENLKKADKKIDIELKEYSLDEKGLEVPWKNVENALPGQEIIKIPRVTNLASNCHIRACIEMKMDKDTTKPVTREMLKGMPEQWEERSDGYFYYTKELKKGESVDLFRSFLIPDDWDTRYNEAKEIVPYYTENGIDILVRVEAVGDEDWTSENLISAAVKTGDTQNPFFYLAAVFLSVSIILIFFGKRRRSRFEKNTI